MNPFHNSNILIGELSRKVSILPEIVLDTDTVVPSCRVEYDLQNGIRFSAGLVCPTMALPRRPLFMTSGGQVHRIIVTQPAGNAAVG